MKIASLGITESWDPFRGCTRVGPGCVNCWAEIQERTRLAHLVHCPHGFLAGPVSQSSAEWAKPLHWKVPRVISAGFRTDLFHESIPFYNQWPKYQASTDCVFTIMGMAEWHTFVTTTKRPDRMLAYCSGAEGFVAAVRKNLWLGVSVHDQATADEACGVLSELAAAGWHTWLSIEPMLAPVGLIQCVPEGSPQPAPYESQPEFIDRMAVEDRAWLKSTLGGVVLGGESGPGARPMAPDWVRKVRDECKAAKVPFCFKQWGEFVPEKVCVAGIEGMCQMPKRGTAVHEWPDGTWSVRVGKHVAGRTLDGREHLELPWAKGGKA